MLAVVAAPNHADGRPAPSIEGCSMTRLKSCNNTNVLVWDRDFGPALMRFFGFHANDRLNYTYKQGKLVDQAQSVLGGPPDDRIDLENGGSLFTACRPHSCPEKGAVAFDARGRIIAVAIVNYHCGIDCAPNPFLDVFIRDLEASTAARTAIVNWAVRVTQDDAKILHQPPLVGPRIHDLANRATAWDNDR